MSWQLAAFTVLGLALIGGFAWYERTRPDARIVALVATLAAFAALGRIAFAAVPNVKPTTDIVLISGYALGGAPGFAVGALAGLTSNFFFGQGPWTPWQMAAWGATGILGAGLARAVAISRPARRGRGAPASAATTIGRVPLAVVCGLAGFAFTVIQDVGDWVTYSDHSRAQLGAYVGQGLGFDAVHAVGCVVFALAFGPALIRSIHRFTRRLQVRWVAPGVALPVVFAIAAMAGAGPALRSPAAVRAAAGPSAPVSYLRRAQNADGGFGPAPGQASDTLFSGWAALGLAAAGVNPRSVTRGSRSVVDYIAGTSGSALDTGSLERTILVLRAAGLPATTLGGRDPLALLEGRHRSNGSFAGQVNLTSFAILALRSAGVAPAPGTTRWLISQQDPDGGFSFGARGGTSDIDDTGAALQALSRVPDAGRPRARAVRYLREHQDGDGGFPSEPGTGSNAQSTAWAIQGLDAAGIAPAALHRHRARSPIAYLTSLIASDGSVRYARGQPQTPVWVTGEALMALEGKPLPLAALPAPVHRAAAALPVASRPRRVVSHHKPDHRRQAPVHRVRRVTRLAQAGPSPGSVLASAQDSAKPGWWDW